MKLLDFLESLTGTAPERGELANPPPLDLATAVLLVEVMRADPDLQSAEREAVRRALRQRFAISDRDLDSLVELAERRSREANDFFAFTSVLNDRLTQEEKVSVVEQMWQVAYADGDANPWERNIVSRVAGLLHVPHGEYIAARLRARAAAGLQEG
ncbi:MAG TPA: TerB family tellurite resistance protein [Ramlibacter sp.]|uniref:tellurite resistance TerB family protein n=1 Tax=Ramlibacter sp. TaxID=1917967 RepID=UPI002CF41BE4|nr:TerB family tellurite resistance protein [Ramlibacter sp.]HVZ46709.1 TerB family tellurite resistance protein [Ramlibacter sp.]